MLPIVERLHQVETVIRQIIYMYFNIYIYLNLIYFSFSWKCKKKKIIKGLKKSFTVGDINHIEYIFQQK